VILGHLLYLTPVLYLTIGENKHTLFKPSLIVFDFLRGSQWLFYISASHVRIETSNTTNGVVSRLIIVGFHGRTYSQWPVVATEAQYAKLTRIGQGAHEKGYRLFGKFHPTIGK